MALVAYQDAMSSKGVKKITSRRAQSLAALQVLQITGKTATDY